MILAGTRNVVHPPPMPIDYGIDGERGLVVCAPSGTLTDEDIFGYQREVW